MGLSAVAVTVGVVGFGGSPYKFVETFDVDEVPRSGKTCAVDTATLNAAPSDNEFLATWDAIPDEFPGLYDEGSGWGLCLPMVVRGCGTGEGPMQSLLALADGEAPCNSAVLHMVVTEVIRIANTLLDLPTVISFGTLLGAKRDQAIIPYTQDADVCMVANDYKQLAEALWRRGYALFTRLNMASVCVGQHHPLAKKLFSPQGRLDGPYFGPPYVDIYTWSYNETCDPSNDVVFDGHVNMKHDDVFPLANLKVYNSSFPAPRNAVAFLEEVYGASWPVPDH
ncbi:LicD family [Plasmodiophora brassicae]|nr:hypothetical protein PBRA_008349 [Plasmodiophora brassicae]